MKHIKQSQRLATYTFSPASATTHVLAAFKQALKEHYEEGGVEARFKRYSENCKIICNGMKKIGFKQLLPNHLQSPIIITFLQPDSSNFIFEKFYEKLSKKGFLIYYKRRENRKGRWRYNTGC